MEKPGAYELVRLPNGVCSIRSRAEDETFHPVVGPVAEAQTLYVRQLRLVDRFREHRGEFVVWDVGLGGAANALTLLRAARPVPGRLRLVSFDRTAEPLAFALAHAEALAYLDGYGEAVRALLAGTRADFANGSHTAAWEVHWADFPGLLRGPAAESLPRPHAIMFDAFSPARNPEMWTQPLFDQLHGLLDPARPCAMATYSRSTLLRVTWLLAGFHVGAGHATGEKEETTLAATTPELIGEPLGRRWLLRARRSTSAEPLREPAYRQARLSAESWERLRAHPQFARLQGLPW